MFHGVYPINRLTPIRNGAFVVNTATSDHPGLGLHWVDIIEYFGSYALQPSAKIYHLGRGKHWVCNPMALQSPLSAVCDQCCIYFLLHQVHDIPMRIILNHFGPNVDENDKLVFDFVQRSSEFDDLTLKHRVGGPSVETILALIHLRLAYKKQWVHTFSFIHHW